MTQLLQQQLFSGEKLKTEAMECIAKLLFRSYSLDTKTCHPEEKQNVALSHRLLSCQFQKTALRQHFFESALHNAKIPPYLVLARTKARLHIAVRRTFH